MGSTMMTWQKLVLLTMRSAAAVVSGATAWQGFMVTWPAEAAVGRFIEAARHHDLPAMHQARLDACAAFRWSLVSENTDDLCGDAL
jgi:hypothetical protein